MSWNYRICRRPSVPGGGFQIHEVYYHENGEVEFYSTNPVSAHGDIPDELHGDLKSMIRAFEDPPLNLDKLDKKFAEQKQREKGK